jgi:hypothetical protein
MLWLLCCPLAVFSQQPRPHPKPPVGHAGQGEKGTQRDKRGTPASPLIVKLDSAQAAEEAARARDDHDEKAASDADMVLVTWVLAGIAVVQVGIFIWQLVMFRGSLGDTRKAADAAFLSAQTAVNVERPHVIFDDVILEPLPKRPDDPDEIYSVRFVFTNYGRTPAFPVSIGFGFRIMKESDLAAAPQYKVIENIQGLLKPGETDRFELPPLLIITPEQRAVLGKDGTFPWFWGQIRYADVFDGVAETGFVAMQWPAERLPTGVEIMPDRIGFRGPAAYTYRRYPVGGPQASSGA